MRKWNRNVFANGEIGLQFWGIDNELHHNLHWKRRNKWFIRHHQIYRLSRIPFIWSISQSILYSLWSWFRDICKNIARIVIEAISCLLNENCRAIVLISYSNIHNEWSWMKQRIRFLSQIRRTSFYSRNWKWYYRIISDHWT